MKQHVHMWFFSHLHKSLTLLFSCPRPLNKKSKVSYSRVIPIPCIMSAFLNMLNQLSHLTALLRLKDGMLETSVALFQTVTTKDQKSNGLGFIPGIGGFCSSCFPFLITCTASGMYRTCLEFVALFAFFLPIFCFVWKVHKQSNASGVTMCRAT